MGSGERYLAVREHLAKVCAEAGRSIDEVRLVAVSKTVGVADAADAIAVGARDFGENRPDGLLEKHEAFPDVQWHFIGNIQSRRIHDIVGTATLIHSLCSLKHARKIDEIAGERGIVQSVLLEVNVSGEESKSGLAPAETASVLEACESLPNISVRGLMTMAPQGDADAARRTFAGLRELREQLLSHLSDDEAAAFTELSMGMSEDWPIAVREGATIVRIGRAIFSPDFTA